MITDNRVPDLLCDCCARLFTGRLDEAADVMRERAVGRGWAIFDAKDLCPRCRKRLGDRLMPNGVPCPDCRSWWKTYGRDLDVDTRPLSRADAEYVHTFHRPMHPTQVGRNHVAAARKAWAEWESLTPGKGD